MVRVEAAQVWCHIFHCLKSSAARHRQINKEQIMTRIIGLFLAAAAFVGYLSYFVVDERKKALVLRFGEISRIVDEPGLYFKVPFVETVSLLSDQIIVWENNDRPVQDNNSQVYQIDAYTLARINDVRLFRETLGADLGQGEARVGAIMDAALRQTYGRRSFSDTLSAERTTIMKEITDRVRAEAKPLGIEVVDIRIRRADLNGAVLDATHNRMRSERMAIAENARSQGQATKTRIEAETDRAFIERTADARRKAEIIQGEGDAERNRIFAEAFQKDPEFFSFYRSMLAYRKALANGDTTMVLDPSSDFFKYFGTNNQGTAAPTQP
jgi:modulator of FtsH protease HflC